MSNNEYYSYLSSKELRTIERLCTFLTESFPVLNPKDFEILDTDSEIIGRIVWEPDIKKFIFVPAGWEDKE